MTVLHAVDTVVVGAGHAGLAVSHELTRAGREHVVLERGGVAERWRHERWDSLRLLTPSWMTRLPGWRYSGPSPDGFMPAESFARTLDRYAASFRAPVVGGTTVAGLTAGKAGRYRLHTDDATWLTRSVVLATGPHAVPRIPEGLARTGLPVVTSNRYRSPRELPAGGVLVVGASSSGVQIADELARSGRDVVLAVGRHTRLPRRYRDRDVFWWLQATGRLARTIDEMPDPGAARREPSMQLVGRSAGRRDVDLGALQRRGVRLAGRLEGIEGTDATFRDDLTASVADADRRLRRVLDAFDQYAARAALPAVPPAERPAPVRTQAAPRRLDLAREGVGTVVLAAGLRPDHAFVRLPILDGDGSIAQYRGVTAAPGVYVVGQRFQHRRDSGLIDGARHDATAVVAHLTTGALPVATGARVETASEESA